MQRTVTSIHTDECPYLNEEHSISVEYAEIPIAGQLSNGYKKTLYSCDEISNCPYPLRINGDVVQFTYPHLLDQNKVHKLTETIYKKLSKD